MILPAIEEAYYGLQNVRTRYKHVVVLTDGGVETGAFEPLLRRMADKGIIHKNKAARHKSRLNAAIKALS